MTDIRCVTDWPGTMDFIKDLILTLTPILTLFIAWRELDKWHDEQVGKASFDLARRLGTEILNFRDAVASSRNPAVMSYEYPNNHNALNPDSQAKALNYVFQKRLARPQSILANILPLLNEAEATWGPTIRDEARPLLEQYRTLTQSIHSYIHLIQFRIDADDDRKPAITESIRKLQAVVFHEPIFNEESNSYMKNQFNEELNESIDKVMSQMRAQMGLKRI